MKYTYSCSVSSDITSVCDTVKKIVSDLGDKLSYEKLMDVRLVLSELMINSCEHGNDNDRNKKVSIDVEADDEAVSIKVSDEGDGFDYRRDVKIDEFSCSGRGLMIVSRLCEQVQVEKSTVSCIIRL